LGQSARAVGQNPRGARLVGINIDRTYLIVFSLSIAIIAIVGVLFSLRHSVFPLMGAPYTMKSFCLIAMAGIGNLTGILWFSVLLGVSEALITAIPGAAGWADLVFFALIVAAILIRSYRQRVK
jgi:branched-chain amino acid transport system permease protein